MDNDLHDCNLCFIQQMRKILNCLRDLSEDNDLTIDRLKTKLVPLLKGHQLLINWFLECIEPPIVESAPGDFETLTCRKAIDSAIDDEADAYENIPQSEIHSDPMENPCSIRYINGGIYYGNRTFSPAKLSFTVNTAECSPVDGVPGSGDRRSFGELTDAKEGSVLPLKCRCVHEIKQFGDARIRDQSRYPFDAEMHAGVMDDAEDSDEEGGRHSTMDVHEFRGIGVTDPMDTTSVFTRNLCDDILLKAHGIRLNPSVHSSMVLNNNDMLNMLKPSLDR